MTIPLTLVGTLDHCEWTDREREREYACGLEDGGTHIDSQLAVSLSTADEVVLPVLECTPYCEEWEWLMGGAYIHTDACMHA